MSVPGPSSRFVYFAGWDLTTTCGLLGEFNPAGFEETLQDLRGSHSAVPCLASVGYRVADDLVFNLWADDSMQDLLDDLHGETAGDTEAERVVIYGWTGGDVIGQLCEFASAYIMKPEPKMPMAALTELTATFKIDGRLSIGHILHELSAETADGDTEGTSIDNTAASSAGGWGAWMYHTLDDDGGDGLDARVVDSADDIAYGALIAFTSVADGGGITRGAEIKSVSGEVLRYVASDWDFTGAPGGSETCTFIIAFERL